MFDESGLPPAVGGVEQKFKSNNIMGKIIGIEAAPEDLCGKSGLEVTGFNL
jgi:hypothetical protein